MQSLEHSADPSTSSPSAIILNFTSFHILPFADVTEDIFPYLLVNIGSGVSIIRVDGPGEGQYSRVSGSSVGGGTFWGLCRLLTGLRDFDDMLQLSMQGNNANVSQRGWGKEGGDGAWCEE
jgi:pantothenate kinase